MDTHTTGKRIFSVKFQGNLHNFPYLASRVKNTPFSERSTSDCGILMILPNLSTKSLSTWFSLEKNVFFL